MAPIGPDQIQPFLPRYEVVSRLGEGGVGTVFKVVDRESGTVRALKALKPPDRRAPIDTDHFEDEYRILRSLHHPSLPEVYDYGIAAGTRYIVMEFVEGERLDHYARANEGELWLLLYQLTEALAFIHEHGLLHRDLKPVNILVKRTGAYGSDLPLVTLLDFGLSYRRTGGGQRQLAGTPAYMAPEIIQESPELTRAVDYYALGVILYELLEGTVPFDGAVNQVLDAHLRDDVVFRVMKDAYLDLYPRIKRLLAKDPRARLEAFDDLRRAVALKVDGTPVALEQAYGMGYLDSFGVLGKRELWGALRDWAVAIGERGSSSDPPPFTIAPPSVSSRTETMDRGATGDAATEVMEPTTVKLQISSGSKDGSIAPHDAAGGIRGAAPRAPRTGGAGGTVPRVVFLSGAESSGKSFMVEALTAELQIRDIRCVHLGDRGAYERLVRDDGANPGGRRVPLDPRSVIIDRFMTGWRRLTSMGSGVVVILDGFGRADKEEREFVGYLMQRLELSADEERDPGVYILITGRDPRPGEAFPRCARLSVLNLIVPPPGRDEVEAILADFHGRMPGMDDRKRLRRYLATKGRSIGGIIGCLREALVKGHLERTAGQWRFYGGPLGDHGADPGGDQYYALLLKDLKDDTRALLTWLSCHPGPIRIRDLTAMSGMKGDALRGAIDRIRPYRVVRRSGDGDGERLEIVSEGVRRALYRVLSRRARADCHRRILLHMGETDRPQAASVRAYHHECLGEYRDALERRVEQISLAVRARDIYQLRHGCERGVELMRQLRIRGAVARPWHLERYFIKRWLDAEWDLTNYGAVVDIVRIHVIALGRRVPVGFGYKYGLALLKTGEVKASRELITSLRARVTAGDSEPAVLLSLLEAHVLHTTGAYEASTQALARIERSPAIDSHTLAEIDTLYMLNYENLGDSGKYEAYMRRAEEVSTRCGHVEQALTVRSSRVLSLINASRYERAKRVLRDAIRVATRHRAYRRLGSFYFLASAAYYEEGNYRSALKYIEKAIRVAVNMGMRELVNDYMLRYALIYQNIGNYGSAIHYAERVRNQVSNEYLAEQYFFALLILLDLHNAISGTRAEAYKRELDGLVGNVQARYRLALYHLVCGDFYRNLADHDNAVESYDLARNIYDAIGYRDDSVRCTIRIARTMAMRGDFGGARDVLLPLRRDVETMESSHLAAEWHTEYLALSESGESSVYTVDGGFSRVVDAGESLYATIGDVNVRLRMSAVLCRANLRRDERVRALRFFDDYSETTKRLASTLTDADEAAAFADNPERRALVAEFARRGHAKTAPPVS